MPKYITPVDWLARIYCNYCHDIHWVDVSQFDDKDDENFLYFTFVNTNYQGQNFFQRLRWHPEIRNFENIVECVDAVALKYPKVIQFHELLKVQADDKRKEVNFHSWNFEKLDLEKHVALWGETELFTTNEGLSIFVEVYNYENNIYLEAVDICFKYMYRYSASFKEADFGIKKKEFIRDVLAYIFKGREYPFCKNELSISRSETVILISYIELILNAFENNEGVCTLKEEYKNTLPSDIWFPEGEKNGV